MDEVAKPISRPIQIPTTPYSNSMPKRYDVGKPIIP